MRRFVLVSLVLLLGGSALGQEAFKIGGYTVEPPDNVRGLKWGCKKAKCALGEPIGPRYYVVVQLSAIPTVEERELLGQRGVVLGDYIGGKSYFASMPVAKSFRHLLKGTSVASVFQLPVEAKCNQAIVDNRVPGYAKKGGLIGVIVGYFEGLEQDWVERRLGELGIEGMHMMGASFHRFRVYLPREKVLELAGESWVQSVGLVSPPQVLFKQGF